MCTAGNLGNLPRQIERFLNFSYLSHASSKDPIEIVWKGDQNLEGDWMKPQADIQPDQSDLSLLD